MPTITDRREINVQAKRAPKRSVTMPIPEAITGDRERLDALFETVRVHGDKIDAALEALRKRIG